jgi:DNA-binding PadR family transcriptional regulator
VAQTSRPPAWLFDPLRPIEFYTLIVLSHTHNYAYDIAQAIRRDLDPSARVSAFGVRAALLRMAKTGWVKSCPHIDPSGRNERPYDLTDYGYAQLIAEIDRLNLILQQAQDYLIMAGRQA